MLIFASIAALNNRSAESPLPELDALLREVCRIRAAGSSNVHGITALQKVSDCAALSQPVETSGNLRHSSGKRETASVQPRISSLVLVVCGLLRMMFIENFPESRRTYIGDVDL